MSLGKNGSGHEWAWARMGLGMNEPGQEWAWAWMSLGKNKLDKNGPRQDQAGQK